MITLPSAEQIKSFTEDQIKSLPDFFDLDQINPGSFAKKTWAKAGPSLVFIVGVDGNTVYWNWANPFNGCINTEGWASNVRKVTGLVYKNGYCYTPETTNPQDNSFLIQK